MLIRMRVTPPKPDMARALAKRGHDKPGFVVASITMNQELRVETVLERKTLIALDVDPRVKYVAPQPFSVRLDIPAIFPTRREALAAQAPVRRYGDPDDGLECVYTPDFLVEEAHPVGLLVESKVLKKSDRMEEALGRRRSVLERLGYRLIHVSEHDVGEKSTLVTNLVQMRDAMKFLREREEESQLQIGALQHAVRDLRGPVPLSQIRSVGTDLTIQLGLACGVIACDLRLAALSNDTIVWPAFGDLAHLQILNFGG